MGRQPEKEPVWFRDIKIARESEKAILVSVPETPNPDEDDTAMGAATWFPKSQLLDRVDNGPLSDICVKEWLVQKKIEAWEDDTPELMGLADENDDMDEELAQIIRTVKANRERGVKF